MAGFAKDGNLYPTSGVYGIDDTKTSEATGWSSAKIEDRISKINIKHALKVDALPTCADNGDGTYTISYVKDGSSYTTTNVEQWFYYMDGTSLKQTIFIDGEETTIDGTGIELDDYAEKVTVGELTDLATTDQSSIVNAINEVFQSSNDAQNEYETAIIGKGGTVSKVGSVATKSEIVTGIESISVGIVEIKNLIPTMTSNTAPSGIVTASTEFTTDLQAWKAFNGTNDDMSDCWASDNTAADEWVQYQFESPKVAIQLVLTNRNYSDGYVGAVKNFTLQGSTNGVTFDTLYTGTNPNSASSAVYVVSFENTTEYAYYRLTILSSYGDANVCIGELQLVGYEKNTTSGIRNDTRNFLIKDGVVQDGYTLVYNSAYGTPTLESGYINTNGNRSIGFDGVDTTGYNSLCAKIIYPTSIPSQWGYFLNATTSVTVNTSISVKAPSVDISSYSTVNLGLAQGTTGAAYAAYIYDMWLE